MPGTKSARKPKAALKPVALPEHIHVSNDELAVVTRLIRVMRQRDPRGRCWLGPFIEWLLYLDAANPDLTYIQPGRAAAAAANMDEFLPDNCKFIKMARKECPGFSFVSAHPNDGGRKSESGESLPPDEEEQFYQLIRLWRKDYPEPPKARQIPKGKMQHEMDPDSD